MACGSERSLRGEELELQCRLAGDFDSLRGVANVVGREIGDADLARPALHVGFELCHRAGRRELGDGELRLPAIRRDDERRLARMPMTTIVPGCQPGGVS